MTDTERQKYDETPGVNYSSLKLMAISPAYAKFMFDHPEELGDKPAYVSGRAVHCAVLEPDQFGSRYVVQPKFSGKGSVAARNEWIDEHSGQGVEIISQEDYDMALLCYDTVWANENVAEMCDGASFEKTIEWEMSGIKCKGRLDIVTDRVIDLKLTRHNTLESVERDFANYDYHAQLAWYHDGAVKAGVITGEKEPAIIAVHASHKSSFVDVAVLEMVDGTLECGRLNYHRLLNKYIACREANWWPGMADRPVFWVLPDWKQYQEIEG